MSKKYSQREIELLAPAKDAEVAIAAINCGADAVYMGANKFGARSAAGNSIADLKRVADYAHKFNARLYATVNTILYDSELKDVERLIRELYRIGVDALIVQDMSILRMDIPPIATTTSHSFCFTSSIIASIAVLCGLELTSLYSVNSSFSFLKSSLINPIISVPEKNGSTTNATFFPHSAAIFASSLTAPCF